MLAVGFASDRPRLVAAGGWALVVAVILSLANAVLVLRRLWRRPA